MAWIFIKLMLAEQAAGLKADMTDPALRPRQTLTNTRKVIPGELLHFW
jgi:hypothetical protein